MDSMSEYLAVTRRTEVPAATLERYDEWRNAPTIHDAVEAVSAFVRERMQYVPGATSVTSTALEAWERGQGVCQDMTHTIHDAVEAVSAFVRERMQYVPGATSVTSTALEAWERGQGVCQDMTHVTLGILRSLGIPARYVSGYFYPKKIAEVGETIRGQSHAWVEYFSGAWTGIDPTNGIGHTERHIVVGRGRDYGDVSPLKGIYHGPKSTGTGAVVEIVRLP